MAYLSLILATVSLATMPMPSDAPAEADRVVLVVHGGAGTLSKTEMTPEREAQYRGALEQALKAGHAVIQKGGSSLDAVEAAVMVLEDNPLFNAGKGAVFTHDGRHELDASIMDGATRRAGSVAGLTVVKNPIRAARAVMEKSPHVMMVGPGADEFARQSGLEIVPNTYFSTESRRKALQRAIEEEQAGKQAGRLPASTLLTAGDRPYFGTVGAVALDAQGHLAAATSTGGMTNKRFGRVGDSPVIGAGTFADDPSCAVSCTGHGEFFIRYTAARDIAALVEYKGLSVDQAADQVINGTLKRVGGEGGAIALDRQGRAAMPFNSEGMYRGTITADGRIKTAIFAE